MYPFGLTVNSQESFERYLRVLSGWLSVLRMKHLLLNLASVAVYLAIGTMFTYALFGGS